MASATARRMDWAAKLDLRGQLGGEFPQGYQEVLDAITLAQTSTAQPSAART
jgi:hypothetical protein